MYTEHFKFTQFPFELPPDPEFFFATQRHNEALAALYYAVQRHKGFVVLSGEVGTGKTLVLQCLLATFQRPNFEFAYVFNPRLRPQEFLKFIMEDFGLPCPADKASLLHRLYEYLIEGRRSGRTTVLLVDEAQHLCSESLEEIRLLTNLETGNDKLLQIVLAGQPELDDVLDSPNLRQLKQRIAFRCRLEPLTEFQTAGYIRRRLQLAGAAPVLAERLFPMSTLVSIHRYSRGIPRLINIICDNALIVAYARDGTCVSTDVIDEIAEDLRLRITAIPPPDQRKRSEPGAKAGLKLLARMCRAIERGDEIVSLNLNPRSKTS